MNKVILTGRLTADPELRQTQSGISSCRFTVAVNRQYADKQTGERQADFIQCIAWRQTAEFVNKYFRKGKMIAVEGQLRNNNYQDRQHPDVTHYTIDIIVENVEFCGDSNKNGQSAAQSGANAANSTAQAAVQAAQNAGIPTDQVSYGSLSDFEEILSDGDVPF
ncbi:MAG: single-stranded DNA-binding protein [Ruminococcus sp.]|nr:single-stranded DNA-binding protein [Ruminococcus sp.]